MGGNMSEHDTKVKANHIEIEESCMKDYEDLSEKELKQLKDSIDDAIEEKKVRDSFKKSNPKAVAIAWILIAVLISIYRYITF